MVYNHTYSTSVFETMGIISSFNIAENIWERYEKFAITKIHDSTLILRGSLYYLKELTPTQASNELDSINPLIPILSNLKTIIEPIADKELQDFRTAVLEFFDAFDFLYFNLQDIADVHSSYEYSKQVLANDWDSSEDQHWNNY